MSKVKIGILGAGYIAAEHLEVLKSRRDVEISSIYSRTKSKAELLAKKFNIKEVCSSIEDISQKSEIDGLMILVSANQMYPVTMELMSKQKVLFIEKPPGLKPEETANILELANKYKTKNMVGFNIRYYSIFKKGMELIKKNGPLLGVSIEGHERFWKVLETNISSELRKSWIYANSTHTIDLLRFFGGNIEKLSSFTGRVTEQEADQFSVSLKFCNGAVGSYISNWYSPGGWTINLYGKGISVIFKPLESGYYLNDNFETHKIEPDDFDKKYKPGFYGQAEAYLNLIKTGSLKSPGQDLKGSYETMVLTEMIFSGKSQY